MTYEELKNQKNFNVNLHYSINEVAILGPSLDTFGGDEPIVTISKVEPFNYHPRDYRDTMIDIWDWLEAVKLAQKLALTPLNERGKVITMTGLKRRRKPYEGF